MKRNIREYDDFCKAIQNEELVFLFGTGISSALTGKPYSWWKWISDGIDNLKDMEQKVCLKNKLEKDDSADNMVSVVGQLIKAAKADGTYDYWMKKAFESNRISDSNLVQTLQKLVLSQVVFATTNYDLLLEDATKLITATYENPSVVFSMLDKHMSTHILHIHGVYDSAHELDNIIADHEQYVEVMENEGAQFIQHILSTRTLVFVGCGKTTEDPNISRFIEFANKNLKMNQTYYFLCKEPVEGLPKHIIQIEYGDNYADLPDFLEEVAQERLKKRLVNNEIVGYTAIEDQEKSYDAILQYHFAHRALPLCGRTGEIKKLLSYIEDERVSLWWAITGQAGSGKSRLAIELLYCLPVTWFGFFLRDDIIAEQIKKFVPCCNTVVIIDYVAGRELEVANIFFSLQEIFAKTHYQLRILFLEREKSRLSGSWYSKLTRRMHGTELENFKKTEYSEQFLDLLDLDRKAVETLIDYICKSEGIQYYDTSELYEAYGRKFERLRFRPLFVQLFVEAWIDNNCRIPQYEKFTQLIESLLIREQHKWLVAVDGNVEVCNAFIALMVRANISGHIALSDIPGLYKNKWKTVENYITTHFFIGKQKKEGQDTLINAFCQNIDSEHEIIAPQFPDLIKEYMFMYYTDEEFLPEMMKEIWQNAASSYAIFITRCLMDFPDENFYRESMNAYKFSTTDEDVLIGRLDMLQNRLIQKNEDPKVYWNIIKNEHVFWSSIDESDSNISEEKMERIAMLKVTGLYKVVQHIGAWSVYDLTDVEEVLDEMLAVRGGGTITLLKKSFLQEHITALSRAGFFDEVEKNHKKLEALMEEAENGIYDDILEMKSYNEKMMNEILKGNFYTAKLIFNEMSNKCNFNSIENVRLLAHACFNIDHLSMLFCELKVLGTGLEMALKCEIQYPMDLEIRYRRLGCQLSILQSQYFENEIRADELQQQIRKYEEEFAGIKLSGTQADDALEMIWGMLKTLKINVANEEEVKKIASEAAELLTQNPHLTSVATTRIYAIHSLYSHHYKKLIPHREVEKLYRYVELNPASESIREAFFNMLKQSEDAGRNRDFFNQDIIREAINDNMYNPMFNSGIPEIDDIFEFDDIFAMEKEQPYVRLQPKIGRNDPCPCGSGKKYKKCCGK